jgi:nanoRNase/pAp phosphatase (c-di-AMP/oligoRNAs hydrolase)
MEKKNNTFEEIWEKLKSCKKVLMTLHTGPDGDSLGSCTAMKYVLEREFGAEVTLVSPDVLAENLAGLSMSKDVLIGKTISDFNLDDYDSLICLDL